MELFMNPDEGDIVGVWVAETAGGEADGGRASLQDETIWTTSGEAIKFAFSVSPFASIMLFLFLTQHTEKILDYHNGIQFLPIMDYNSIWD